MPFPSLPSLVIISLVLVDVSLSWLIWQLLQQNGRILCRLADLEQRIDEWPWEESTPAISVASEGGVSPADRHSGGHVPPPVDEPEGPRAAARRIAEPNLAALARSKIERNGLKAGTAAPHFRLPLLPGGEELSIEDLRGRRVLLVFSDPQCGPCGSLAPELEKLHRRQGSYLRSADRPGSGVVVLMISRGEPAANLVKVKEHDLTFPIVLQRQWEISRLYAMFATPIAYLIDEEGVIAEEVAAGVDAIMDLVLNRVLV